MQVRGEAALGFDGGEVLHVEPGRSAQVLEGAIDLLGEVHRVAGLDGVVVGAMLRGTPSASTAP